MFYVDCQGRLLDKYEPSVKEQRAVAFTSWNGHAFFYKSARTVAKCEPIGERARYRGERKPGETPEFKDWWEWEGEAPAAISTLKTWSRSGGSSWPRGTARRWSCEA